MSVTFLGNDEYRVYVELGPAIREVNEAEHLCGAGHIVLSPTAWELCTQSLYNHELLEDQQHARVGTEWLNSFMSLSLFENNSRNESISMQSWNYKNGIMSKSATHVNNPLLWDSVNFSYPLDSFILEATKVKPSGDAKRRVTVVHAQ